MGSSGNRTTGAVARDDDDDSEDRWVMVAMVAALETGNFDGTILVDSGSDEHVCRADFGAGCEYVPGDTSRGVLRDVQGGHMTVSGTRRVPFSLTTSAGGEIQGEAQFKAGACFKKNVLSVGKLYDAGFDVVFSQSEGPHMKRGSYRVPLQRRGNTFYLEPTSIGVDVPASAGRVVAPVVPADGDEMSPIPEEEIAEVADAVPALVPALPLDVPESHRVADAPVDFRPSIGKGGFVDDMRKRLRQLSEPT